MDSEEHVLRQIFGPRSVRSRSPDQRENQVFVAVDQLLKGPFVPAPATLDELALVDRVHPVTVLEHAVARIVSRPRYDGRETIGNRFQSNLQARLLEE